MRRSFVYIVLLSWQFFVLLLCTITSAQESSERSFVITDLKLAVTTSDSVRKLTEK